MECHSITTMLLLVTIVVSDEELEAQAEGRGPGLGMAWKMIWSVIRMTTMRVLAPRRRGGHRMRAKKGGYCEALPD